ncbi:hypothetical protein HID58_094218, partial [Brassica napus]
DSTSYNVGPPLDGDPSEFISDKELLGDILEEEYYTSQVVRNRKSYFETPKDKLFTQSFLPLEGEIKGTVYCYRGGRTLCLRLKLFLDPPLGVHVSRLRFQHKLDVSEDLHELLHLGLCCFHRQSSRSRPLRRNPLLHGVLGGRTECISLFSSSGDMKKVPATSLSFFKHARCSDPFRICISLLFSLDMKPSKPHLLADTWTAMLDNKMVGKAIHHPEKLKIIASNPQRYTGKPRVRTMREILRKTQYVQDNFGRVIIPLMTVHGTYDGVTCPSSSTLLYEKASRTDKTLKLYDGMYHSLIQGEPEENAATVLKDMREWIDERVKRY